MTQGGAQYGRSRGPEQAPYRSATCDDPQQASDTHHGDSPYCTGNTSENSQTLMLRPVRVTNRVSKRKQVLRSLSSNSHSSNPTASATHLGLQLSEMSLRSTSIERLHSNSRSEHEHITSLHPPITKTSLGELDLQRIVEDPKLRHDLNFEREIAFRPNYYGPKGARKKAIAEAYWEALTKDLFLCINKANSPDSDTELYSSTNTTTVQSISETYARLREMFSTVSEILKSLVPDAESVAIDQALDVDLLLQQLEKGVCDLVRLSEWLGTLLMGSCSPCRDPRVLNMVSTIQNATKSNDARGLVAGIEELFSILETMKLDVANHQIRELKYFMFESNIEFEQSFFMKQKMLHGLQTREVEHWYALAILAAFQQQHDRCAPGQLPLSTFTKAVINLVMSNDPKFPNTFTFDVERLQSIQADTRNCVIQETYYEVFIRTLEYIGYTRDPPPDVRTNLLQRISKIADFSWAESALSAQSEDIVLEIVRTAYSVCNISSLPTDEHVFLAKRDLEDTRSCHCHEACQCRGVELELSEKLEEVVASELSFISHLTPLQIHNHYYPTPVCPHLEDRRSSLEGIGKRLAHIIVLHWRTWAPILYCQVYYRVVEAYQTQGRVRNRSSPVRRKSHSAPNLLLRHERTPHSSDHGWQEEEEGWEPGSEDEYAESD